MKTLNEEEVKSQAIEAAEEIKSARNVDVEKAPDRTLGILQGESKNHFQG